MRLSWAVVQLSQPLSYRFGLQAVDASQRYTSKQNQAMKYAELGHLSPLLPVVANELLPGFLLSGQPRIEAILLIYERKYSWWQKQTVLLGACDCRRCLQQKMLEFCISGKMWYLFKKFLKCQHGHSSNIWYSLSYSQQDCLSVHCSQRREWPFGTFRMYFLWRRVKRWVGER